MVIVSTGYREGIMADFYGKPVGILENKYLRLEYLLQAGPRIVRLFPAGSQENLLAELPELIVPTPYGDYHFTGGHRLWHAPEQMPRSYIPDNEGLQVMGLEDGINLIQPVEVPTGILKGCISIWLMAEQRSSRSFYRKRRPMGSAAGPLGDHSTAAGWGGRPSTAAANRSAQFASA